MDLWGQYSERWGRVGLCTLQQKGGGAVSIGPDSGPVGTIQ